MTSKPVIRTYAQAVSWRENLSSEIKGLRTDRHSGSYLSRSSSAGVGAVVKHAAVFSLEEKDQLWKSGVIGNYNPVALQRAVFFYVGTFCLRREQEQRDLKALQFVHSTDPDWYTYIKNGSKNRSGVNAKVANKVVPVFACPSACPNCLVHWLHCAELLTSFARLFDLHHNCIMPCSMLLFLIILTFDEILLANHNLVDIHST